MAKTITSLFKKIFSWALNNITLVVFLGVGIFLNFEELEYNPRVIFFDVGQGDAIFLIDSSGKKILVDGGDGDYVVYSIANYLHPRDREIDLLILTHPHADHISGLIDILERYSVKEVLYFPSCYDSKMYEYFLSLDENLKRIDPNYYFEGEDFSLELLFPKVEVSSGCMEFSNINNASVVMRLESDHGNMLLTGDAEHEVENWLLENYSQEELQSEILKAGHHCSRTASSTRFLEYIQAERAICCVGEENSFGHPHEEVIENFEKLGIEYDLTYGAGDVVFEF